MQVSQVRWQSYLIYCRTNPSHDLIWPDESWSQLSRFKCSANACCGGYSEKYVITSLKLKRPPPLVDSRLHACNPVSPSPSRWSVAKTLAQVLSTLRPVANTMVSGISYCTMPHTVPFQCWNDNYYYT